MKLLASTLVCVLLSAPALAASPKQIKPVTCEGEAWSAHTLIVGNCSFVGLPAKRVMERCELEAQCRVRAYGWDNGHDVYIITRVMSAERKP